MPNNSSVLEANAAAYLKLDELERRMIDRQVEHLSSQIKGAGTATVIEILAALGRELVAGEAARKVVRKASLIDG